MSKQERTDDMGFLLSINELSWAFKEAGDLDDFLRRIVEKVAQHVRADSCAVYVYDTDTNQLMMRASFGEVAHWSPEGSLAIGEGIAGTAIEENAPMVVESEDAQTIRKAADVSAKCACLATPIKRGLTPIGVLVVERGQTRRFEKRVSRILAVLASQLANVLEISRMLLDQRVDQIKPVDAEAWKRFTILKGEVGSSGLALGKTTVANYRRTIDMLVEEYRTSGHTAVDVDRAVQQTAQQLQDMQMKIEQVLADETALIFAAHLLMLKDPEFIANIHHEIDKGIPAVQAIASLARTFMDRFSSSNDPYIAEKAHDVEDLALRLLCNLVGDDRTPVDVSNFIVIAENMTLSDLLKYYTEGALGIVLTSGGITGHVAILARSLQVPLLIVDNPELGFIETGTPVFLDAQNGFLHLRPDEKIVAEYNSSVKHLSRMRDDTILKEKETTTADGTRISLKANINLTTEIAVLHDVQFDGVGLYRTEFPFLLRPSFPTEEEQLVVYKKLTDWMKGRPITFRTLDIGGDKVLSYYHCVAENNPFLGMRSLRFLLEHEEIFSTQLRAILRAGVDADLSIMFPMVSSCDELQAAKELVLKNIQALKKKGVRCHSSPLLGIMVEVPSAVEIIEDLAKESDFLSLGTNDLVQYMLAVDRTNEKVAHHYRPCHPSVIRAIKRVIDAARAEKRDISICGDMAHNERFLPLLLGLGAGTLSVSSALVLRTKALISQVDMGKAKKLAVHILGLSHIRDIEEALEAYHER